MHARAILKMVGHFASERVRVDIATEAGQHGRRRIHAKKGVGRESFTLTHSIQRWQTSGVST